MSGFSADWLARREPHDGRARNPAVLDAVMSYLNGIPRVHILDLACGTGSLLRALAPRLPRNQNWRLIDNEPSLLELAAGSAVSFGVAADTVGLDLNIDLTAALRGPLDVVVTSALLDLVSEVWLERLVAALAARALPLYAVLSYDGRTEFVPADPADATITDAVNMHQRTDKGFGPALGPAAASTAIARLTSLGYAVVRGQSDWLLRPTDREIQLDLVTAWAGAASAIGTPQAEIDGWVSRRSEFVAAGRSSIRVGHTDFWARQIDTR